MFGPLRFNPLLKAIPGLAHLRLTPQAAQHAQMHSHLYSDEQVDVKHVQTVPGGIKETQVRETIHRDVQVSTKKGQITSEVHEHIAEDIRVKKVERLDVADHTRLTHVHATLVEVMQVEMTPPHPPRDETPIYQRTHHHLIFTLDTPCAICGVRHSTLHDHRENLFHAQAIETHHYPIERSLLNACDPKKVHHLIPQVKDHASLEAFIDSEENIMVLCDIHHRHPHYGIHHLLAQDFFIQPFLFGGYQVVAETGEIGKVMAANEKVMKRHAQLARN